MKSLFIIVLAVGLYVATCGAVTYYVVPPGTATNPPPHTNGWASAGTNIIEIATIIGSGAGVNTILVSNGTYFLTNEIVFTATNWGANLKSLNGRDVTILDGNYPNNTNRVVRFVGALNTLDGFTIRNGFATNAAWNEGGGGIKANRTYIYNCRVINNVTSNATGEGGGGGILAFGNPCVITNCDIIGNIAYGSGAGIWSQEAGNSLHIFDCNIISNQILNNTDHAAGIFVDAGSIISNCVIAYNSATNAYTGGVTMYNNATMRNCLIYGNQATIAGGIYLYAGRAANDGNQVENCTIVSNYASLRAGGVYVRESTRTNSLVNCIVYHNEAGTVGTSNLYFHVTNGVLEYMHTCIAPTSMVPATMESPLNTGNIESDPHLADFTSIEGCRLVHLSPCINSGTNRAWMDNTLDLDGMRRIRYRAVDMGAYELIHQGTITIVR